MLHAAGSFDCAGGGSGVRYPISKSRRPTPRKETMRDRVLLPSRSTRKRKTHAGKGGQIEDADAPALQRQAIAWASIAQAPADRQQGDGSRPHRQIAAAEQGAQAPERWPACQVGLALGPQLALPVRFQLCDALA